MDDSQFRDDLRDEASSSNATHDFSLQSESRFGVAQLSEDEGRAQDWFTVFDNKDLKKVHVTEQYLPVTSMGTLLVLLTMNENDVFPEEDEHEDD